MELSAHPGLFFRWIYRDFQGKSWRNGQIVKIITSCERLYTTHLQYQRLIHTNIKVVLCYESHTYQSFISIILAHICSASFTLNHSCSVILTLIHPSYFNAILVLHIYLNQKSFYKKLYSRHTCTITLRLASKISEVQIKSTLLQLYGSASYLILHFIKCHILTSVSSWYNCPHKWTTWSSSLKGYHLYQPFHNSTHIFHSPHGKIVRNRVTFLKLCIPGGSPSSALTDYHNIQR